MAVNLQKGQRVSLSKEDGTALRRVMVGLGWDMTANRSGFQIDCDASALLCAGNGKLTRKEDAVYFGNLKHPSQAVHHSGDNLTGKGEGDDEQIFVALSEVPNQYEKIVFVVNIYQAKERKQHFGMIQNAFIRIVDTESRKEMLRYSLSEQYEGLTALIFGEIYRKEGQWKFNAVGQGTQDPSLAAIIARYS
ncbi:MAG: TerD family protein [Spirochaetaceae bacterium]|jgi:stress response protein SCP2|nr:TerD family protein [Spirochaetaceae bacterium]